MTRELFWVSRTPGELNMSVAGFLEGGPVFVGETGLPLVVQFTVSSGVALDLSNSSGRQLLLRKPGGSLLTHSGSLYTDGRDGRLKYVTASGDLTVGGNYEAQGFASPQSGVGRYSEVFTFSVQDNLRSG
jgi:hypothetical protein